MGIRPFAGKGVGFGAGAGCGFGIGWGFGGTRVGALPLMIGAGGGCGVGVGVGWGFGAALGARYIDHAVEFSEVTRRRTTPRKNDDDDDDRAPLARMTSSFAKVVAKSAWR